MSRWSYPVWKSPGGPPEVWGRNAWGWLHGLAISYPLKPTAADARLAADLLKKFFRAIPCPLCHVHIREHVMQFPPELASGQAFQLWVWKFHNAVNRRLRKPLIDLTEYLLAYDDEIKKARLSDYSDR